MASIISLQVMRVERGLVVQPEVSSCVKLHLQWQCCLKLFLHHSKTFVPGGSWPMLILQHCCVDIRLPLLYILVFSWASAIWFSKWLVYCWVLSAKRLEGHYGCEVLLWGLHLKGMAPCSHCSSSKEKFLQWEGTPATQNALRLFSIRMNIGVELQICYFKDWLLLIHSTYWSTACEGIAHNYQIML